MRPGCPERREHEYIRRGTLSLIANRNMATGQVLAPSLGPTRTEADFADHIARTLAIDPDAGWRFIADKRNTHHSATLVRLVAARCGLTTDLGVKGWSGVLQSQATRAAFLSDPNHRVQFLYTPMHTSWLKQIELWFSTLARRVLKRGNFASLAALGHRIRDFIAYCHRTAAPFRWVHKGRSVCH